MRLNIALGDDEIRLRVLQPRADLPVYPDKRTLRASRHVSKVCDMASAQTVKKRKSRPKAASQLKP
jgi:hypothetical protein